MNSNEVKQTEQDVLNPSEKILLSTLTSVASDVFSYSLRLDNELSARPPRGRHGLWTGLKTQTAESQSGSLRVATQGKKMSYLVEIHNGFQCIDYGLLYISEKFRSTV